MSIRVMIVDDSPVVRHALQKALGDDPAFHVVAVAGDPEEAWGILEHTEIDVMTLDIEMPGMDGLSFLEHLREHHPVPVVIVSSKARRSPRLVLDALRLGALAVVPKPHAEYPILTMIADLKATLQSAPQSRPDASRRAGDAARAPSLPPGRASSCVIAVGSSTGGTGAFELFARALPDGHPCVLLAQHLPPDFIPRFADRLDEVLPSRVAVARGNDPIEPNRIYIAPASHHLGTVRHGAVPTTELVDAEKTNFHKPSVDVLLRSVALTYGRHAVGVMLTGMGMDGARGLLAMRRAGAFTLGQDEASCVVYGMPKAAFELGAVQEQGPPELLARRAIELLAQPLKQAA